MGRKARFLSIVDHDYGGVNLESQEDVSSTGTQLLSQMLQSDALRAHRRRTNADRDGSCCDRTVQASRRAVSSLASGVRLTPRRHCCVSAMLHRMKTTLSVSRRGVVTLPAKLRQALGIKADDQLIAETTPEGLLLRSAVTLPIEIYSAERIREFDEAEAELKTVLRRRKKPRSARR